MAAQYPYLWGFCKPPARDRRDASAGAIGSQQRLGACTFGAFRHRELFLNFFQTLESIANRIPETTELYPRLVDCVWLSATDLQDGYWNCPLEEESERLTAFVSEAGTWCWRCLSCSAAPCIGAYEPATHSLFAPGDGAGAGG